KALETVNKREFINPFDLSALPLLRAQLLEITGERHFLLIDMHHIVTDAVTDSLWYSELFAFYEGMETEPLSVQFKDYATWQKRVLTPCLMERQANYWLGKLENFKYTEIPPDKKNGTGEKEYKKEFLRLDATTSVNIDAFCSKHNISKFACMIGIFQVLLAREVGKNDVTVGARISRREFYEIKDMAGCFLDKILLRTTINPSDTIVDNILNFNRTVIEAMDNSLLPYEEMETLAKKEYRLPEGELFKIRVNYIPPLELNGKRVTTALQIKQIPVYKDSSKHSIGLNITEQGDAMELMVIYNHSLYDEKRIRRIMTGFGDMITAISPNTGENIPVSQLY
ncbi:MAG: hypothetical protein GY757_08660, partial [bacterium]|nr:hypothetical protein [bacterium]